MNVLLELTDSERKAIDDMFTYAFVLMHSQGVREPKSDDIYNRVYRKWQNAQLNQLLICEECREDPCECGGSPIVCGSCLHYVTVRCPDCGNTI